MINRLSRYGFVFGIAFAIICAAGCSDSSKDTAADSSAVSNEQEAMHDHDHDHGDHSHGSEAEEIEKALAGFADGDRESVLAQKICLVGGEPLGSMGAPEKVDVNGTTIWICCEGCRETLLEDSEKYLAQLEQVLNPTDISDAE
jgi:hypothetical protein